LTDEVIRGIQEWVDLRNALSDTGEKMKTVRRILQLLNDWIKTVSFGIIDLVWDLKLLVSILAALGIISQSTADRVHGLINDFFGLSSATNSAVQNVHNLLGALATLPDEVTTVITTVQRTIREGEGGGGGTPASEVTGKIEDFFKNLPFVGSFQGGGIVPRTGLALVHEGEEIRRGGQRRESMEPTQIVQRISIDSVNTKATKEEMYDVMNRATARALIKMRSTRGYSR